MSGFLNDLLKKRQSSKINDYVFPSSVKEGGYLVEPQQYMDIVTRVSGVNFILHDLRRTFLTIADSVDTPAYVLKKLANHTVKNDVTAGYIVLDIERLRKYMQLISDCILGISSFNQEEKIAKIDFK